MCRQEVVLRFGLVCTNLTYVLDNSLSEHHPPVLPEKQPILRYCSPKAGGTITTIKRGLRSRNNSQCPFLKLSLKQPRRRPRTTTPCSLATLCNTSLSREIYYGAVDTILPLRKKIKIRNTLQEDAMAKAKS